MSEQVEKKLYVVNHKSSLPVMMGGQEYKIPSGATSIEDLALKLDVDEDLALSVAKHAASVYATVRPSTGAKERQKPPQKWVELVTRPIDEPPPKSRVEVLQEVEAGLAEEEVDPFPVAPYEFTVRPKSREEIYNRSLKDNN